jgi:SAM-dependent methyltransferase
MSATDSREGVFRAEQFHSNVPDGMSAHYWHQARNRVVERRLAALPGARDSLIVEIGCGRGIVVEHLRARGFQAIGAELGHPRPISASVAPYLHLGTDALGLPASIRTQARIVLVLDVLEHLDNPAGFLTAIVDAYPSLTRILVTLPARQELFSNYDEFYGHRLRFDLTSLARLAAATRLRIEDQSYFFHALYAPTRLVSALGRKRSTVVGAPTGLGRMAHRLLGAALAAEEYLIPATVRGTSLWAILAVPDR